MNELKPNGVAAASAVDVNQDIRADVELPADRFWLRDNNGDEAQIRLEPNGSIVICYTKRNRRVIEIREMSWHDFLPAFRNFVDSL